MRRVCATASSTLMLISAAALCVAADPSTPLGAGWPGWRGPNRDGISPEKGINRDWTARPPKELWRIRLGDAGHAGAAVADGKLFILDHKGSQDVVRAVDVKTGTDVWTCAYEDTATQDYGFSRATPLVEDGRVWTVSMMGNVHCLDAKDGKVLWRRNLAADFGGRPPQWKMSMSRVIDGDRLILCPGARDGSVVAVNKNTGELIWKGGGSDVPGYSTPVVATLARRKQVVVFTASRLVGADAADGRLLWSVPWKTQYDVNAATPVVVGEDSVFITSGYGRGCARVRVTAEGASIAWENRKMQSHFNSPVLFGGRLYGTTDPGDLVCMDPDTGAVAWRQDGFEKGGVVAVDGCLIAQNGRSGTLVLCALSPDGYRELGRINAFPRCRQRAWAPPIVADGKLFARDLNELACYDLK